MIKISIGGGRRDKNFRRRQGFVSFINVLLFVRVIVFFVKHALIYIEF